MTEELIITKGNKTEKYELLFQQIKALVEHETNTIANACNVVAAIKETFDFLWVGFYYVDTPNELVLGPFQGPIACTRIKKGKGVCGSAWSLQQTMLIDNVDEFPGHIACSSNSKSEIVVPIYDENQFYGVLDIDSEIYNTFDKIDQHYLEEIITSIRPKIIFH